MKSHTSLQKFFSTAFLTLFLTTFPMVKATDDNPFGSVALATVLFGGFGYSAGQEIGHCCAGERGAELGGQIGTGAGVGLFLGGAGQSAIEGVRSIMVGTIRPGALRRIGVASLAAGLAGGIIAPFIAARVKEHSEKAR